MANRYVNLVRLILGLCSVMGVVFFVAFSNDLEHTGITYPIPEQGKIYPVSLHGHIIFTTFFIKLFIEIGFPLMFVPIILIPVIRWRLQK